MSFLEENINTIIHGDSFELIKLIPDKSIDLIITDPPYGIKRDKGYNGIGTTKNKSRKHKGGWDDETPPKEFFDELFRVGKKIVIFGGNYFTDKLPRSNHWDVWDKKGQFGFDNNFSDCELIYTNINGNCNKFTVVQQGFVNDGDERLHPTQKPERLIRMILSEYGTGCNLVADFFSGSGTVSVVAKQEGYNFIGIEKDEHFYLKSLDRLNGINTTGQTSIFTDFENI